ncbi:hypothetical protein [Oceanirhabdus sp. W0125-5]|uniref:hypothetical protein n=1 Tax=Oceanirhabdus sp. W0125-5 TaxID=2999116 RepID=UPI0022F2C33C|nr:hypothetical protein [Oceanirhabdus sp. W0125-5]WBW98161.1 hypothetical protein OW730_05185 [Oceanirhabdus sp. W0125-5]
MTLELIQSGDINYTFERKWYELYSHMNSYGISKDGIEKCEQIKKELENLLD